MGRAESKQGAKRGLDKSENERKIRTQKDEGSLAKPTQREIAALERYAACFGAVKSVDCGRRRSQGNGERRKVISHRSRVNSVVKQFIFPASSPPLSSPTPNSNLKRNCEDVRVDDNEKPLLLDIKLPLTFRILSRAILIDSPCQCSLSSVFKIEYVRHCRHQRYSLFFLSDTARTKCRGSVYRWENRTERSETYAYRSGVFLWVSRRVSQSLGNMGDKR